MEIKKITKLSLVTFIILLITGCASTKATDPADPYERYNRAIFKFNYVLDKAIYRPVAKGYDKVTPRPVKRGVTNVFSNINDISNVPNDLLQVNFKWMFEDTGRVLVNSTIGIGGIFDVAKHMGLPKHNQDFGLTMAKWGVRKSPYFLLPFFGPGTARDQFAFFVNYQLLSIWPYINPLWVRYSIYGVKLINDRAQWLAADKLVDEAFDPYVFVRDAYLQHRNMQIQAILHPNGAAENQVQLADDEQSSPEPMPAEEASASDLQASSVENHASVVAPVENSNSAESHK